jgi:ferredoxin
VSTEIYYFSGTGNSLRVAQELQKRLTETELIPILAFNGAGPVSSNGVAVGFVFPHYASSLPRVVSAFVEELDLDAARYLFAIATRGGTKTYAFRELDRVLAKHGRHLDAFWAITMPSGVEPLVPSYASQITEDRIQRLETRMLARLDSIQQTIQRREGSRVEDQGDTTREPRWYDPLQPLVDALSPLLVSIGKRAESSFEFYVDNKCSGCGTCEHVCLSGKLRLVDSRPEWQQDVHCHGCWACVNFCPEQAIQVASKWYLKSHTEVNGRYHHPAISADDIAAQKGARAAA